MRIPRVSLATAGFAVLVIALNLGVARHAMPELAVGTLEWTTGDVFLLLPMIDVVLIALYRLSRRERRTRGAVGFIVAGAVSTCSTFAAGQLAPETTTKMIEAACKPIEYGLILLFHDVALRSPAVQWAIAYGYEYLVPMAICNIPPLLVALLGAGLARQLGTGRSAVDARSSASRPAEPSPVPPASPS